MGSFCIECFEVDPEFQGFVPKNGGINIWESTRVPTFGGIPSGYVKIAMENCHL